MDLRASQPVPVRDMECVWQLSRSSFYGLLTLSAPLVLSGRGSLPSPDAAPRAPVASPGSPGPSTVTGWGETSVGRRVGEGITEYAPEPLAS